jgi:hypothetical protein
MKKIIFLFFIALMSKTFSQNNALQIDIWGNDVSLAYSPVLDFDMSSKFTIEAWFNTTTNTGLILSDKVDVAPFTGWEVGIVYNKMYMELASHYINSNLRIESVNSFNDGNWHHVAFVYKGIPNASNCEIWVDGVLQTLNITNNNLTTSLVSGNPVHVGSRNGTSYLFNGSLDEVRIWKRVLCGAEIQAHKNCSLSGNESLLEAYYKFNQGIPSGNNPTVTSLIDSSPNGHTGTLSGFALTGPTSNWIASGAAVSGTCGAFSGGVSITGSGTMCIASTETLIGSGASSYTWLPGNQNTSSIFVSPAVTTVYTLMATTASGCLGTVFHTLTVSSCSNNALHFGGTGDVELNYSSALNFNVNDNFTIETWAKTTESYAAIIWSNHVDVPPFAGHEMAIVNGKPVMDLTQDYVTAALRAEATTLVNDGTWHHLAFVYKGIPNVSGCEIYIDGVLQTLTANPNNLTASCNAAVSNEVHIGSRDNTTYFSDIALDELRVWKRALCSAEIQAHKNCTLNGNETQLEAYYNFNQGIGGGNNPGVTTLIDSSPNVHTGTLTNFVLNGPTSNWILSDIPVTGTCTPFNGGTINVSGENTICIGMSTNLSASGATTYTWLPGNMQTANVLVSPGITTTYSVSGTNSAGCLVKNTFTVIVVDCTNLNELSKNGQAQIYPNPSTGEFTIKVGVTTHMTITNAIGQTVYKSDLQANENEINITHLKEGIYFVNGQNVKGNWQKKLVLCR